MMAAWMETVSSRSPSPAAPKSRTLRVKLSSSVTMTVLATTPARSRRTR